MSSKKEATITFKANTANLNANINKADTSLKKLRAELRLNETQMKGSGTNTESLKNKLSILSQEQVQARAKTEGMSEKLEEAKKVFGENSVEAQNFARYLLNAENAEAKIQNEINETNAALKQQESATSQLGQTVSTSDSKIKSLNGELETNKVKLQGTADKTQLLKERQDLLSKQMNESKTKTKALEEALEKCGKETGKSSDEYQELKEALNAAEREQAEIQNEINGTNKELKEQKTALEQCASGFSGFGEKVKSAITTLAKVAAVIATVVAALVTLSAKVGIEFESAFAGVIKTVDATAEELAVLKTGILDMTSEIPASASAIAEVAESAGQLGIQTENILGFTETMTNLGVATNMGATDAASNLAKLANITGMSQKDFDRLGSSIVALGNNFATTESDIVNMAMRLSGAGSQIGMSEADIMALSTALSSVGIEAEMGGGAFSKVMVNMQVATKLGTDKVKELEKATGMTRREIQLMASNSGSDFKAMCDSLEMTTKEVNNIVTAGANLEDFSNIAGMTGEEFKQAFEQDAVGAIGAFINGLGTAEEKGTSAIELLDEMGISEVRLRDALLRAGGATELFSNAVELSNTAWDENTALTNEASQRYETMESKIQLLKNGISKLGITAYDSFKGDLSIAVSAGTKAVGKLTKAFEKGGLSGAMDSAGGILSDLVDEVSKGSTSFKKILTPIKNVATAAINLGSAVLPKAASGFKFVTENLDKFVPVAIAGVAAIKGYAAATAIAGAIAKVTTAVQATTTAIKGATTATQVLGAVTSATPIGLVVAAVAALTAGLFAYKVMAGDAKDETDLFGESLKEMEELSDVFASGMDGINSSIQSAAQSSGDEAAATTALVDELKTLTDENGIVKDGYQDRAEVILGELNTALGTEMEMVDGVISGYEEQISTIEDLIAIQKAQSLLSGSQDAYNQALELLVTNIDDTKAALDKYTTAINDHESALTAQKAATRITKDGIMELFDSTNSATQGMIEYVAGMDTGNKSANNLFKDLATGNYTLDELSVKYGDLSQMVWYMETAEAALIEKTEQGSEKYRENKAALEELKGQISDAQITMSNWENLDAALVSGNLDEINQACSNMSANIATVSNSSQETVTNQMTSSLDMMQNYFGLVEEGVYSANDAIHSNVVSASALALGAFSELGSDMTGELGKMDANMVAEILQSAFAGTLTAEGKKGAADFITALDGLDGEAKEKFASAVEGALQGMKGFDEIQKKAKEEGKSFLDALKDVLEVNSPSKATMRIFKSAGEGAIKGTEEGLKGLNEKGKSICESFLDIFRDAGLGERLQSFGSNIMQLFGFGIFSEQENTKAAGRGNAEAAQTGAGEVDPTSTGSTFGELLNSGIFSLNDTLKKSGKTLASGAKNSADAVNPTSTGKTFGTRLNAGVLSTSGTLRSSGTNIANNAKTGAGGVNPTATGSNFGKLLSGGVGSTAGTLKNSGRNIADNAKTGAAGVNPSATGVGFGNSYSTGISATIGSARGSGVNIANNANSGAGSVSAHGVGASFGSGFAGGIGSMVGTVVNTARNLALSAWNAAKNALDINSPSRKTRLLGRGYDEGLIYGMEDMQKDVEKTGENVALAVLSSANGVQEAFAGIGLGGSLSRLTADRTLSISESVQTFVSGSMQKDIINSIPQFDYNKMAQAMAKISTVVNLNGREFGRMVREVPR